MVEFARQQAITNFMNAKPQPHQALPSNQIDQILPGEKVVIVASSEARVKGFLEKRAQELENRELLIGVFDHWLGATAPFKKVCVCQQDFKQMAQQACTLLVSRITVLKSVLRICSSTA